MQVTIERRTQINGMDRGQASSLKHIASYTPPSYMKLKGKDRKASARHPSIMLGERYSNSMLIPRGINVEWVCRRDGVTVVDCTVSHPVSFCCNIQPTFNQAQAIDQAAQHRGGVILVHDDERIPLGVMLAARLGQRCLVIVPYAAHVRAWRDAIEQATGEDCGIISGQQCSEGTAFTVADMQALERVKGNAANSHCPEDGQASAYGEKVFDYGLVLVDCCYKKMRTVYNCANQQPARYRFGLASSMPNEGVDDRVLIDAALGYVVASTLAAR